VGSILHAWEVHHAVEAGVAGAATLVAVRVEFLLGEDVAAGLGEEVFVSMARSRPNCAKVSGFGAQFRAGHGSIVPRKKRIPYFVCSMNSTKERSRAAGIWRSGGEGSATAALGV
jgi:hypothetical protein